MAAQREWFEKDYYRTLGVDTGASAKEITKAYRKLARDLHPDQNPGDAVAEEKFKEVAAAYDVLGDDAKRKEYDEVRAMGPMSGMGLGGAVRPAGSRSTSRTWAAPVESATCSARCSDAAVRVVDARAAHPESAHVEVPTSRRS